MTAEEYKTHIIERNVLDHTTINVTLKELVARKELDLANEIHRVIKNNKIEKPVLHSQPYDGSPNYYRVDLSFESIRKIIDILFDLEASFVNENGEVTPTASFYASLVDKWSELT